LVYYDFTKELDINSLSRIVDEMEFNDNIFLLVESGELNRTFVIAKQKNWPAKREQRKLKNELHYGDLPTTIMVIGF